MAFFPFKKLIFKDDAVSRFQQNVAATFTSIQNSLFINALLQNGTLAQGIAFTSGADNYISHGLDYVPRGYIVTSSNAAVNIYTSATTNPDPQALIILVSNANATVNIVFF